MGRKNGQTCPDNLSVKHKIIGRKKNQNWDVASDEAVTLFWTTILIVMKS